MIVKFENLFIARYLEQKREKICDNWESQFWIGQNSQIEEFRLELINLIKELRKEPTINQYYCHYCGHDLCNVCE